MRREDRQVHPGLPVVNGPRGGDQQQTHHSRQDSEREPCPRTKALHLAACPLRHLERACRRTRSSAAAALSDSNLGATFEAAVGCSAGLGGRLRYKHQACSPPAPGMARINRATCSGSSSWTKCRAPGIRNSSEPGRNSWNVRATPLFRERSASPKMIRTGRLNSFSLGIICVAWTGPWAISPRSGERRQVGHSAWRRTVDTAAARTHV